MSRRGFSAIELVVALTVAGVVATATHSLFRMTLAAYRYQEQAAGAIQTLRISLLVLRQQLGDLDGTDPAGSDLVQIGPTAVIYRSMVSTYFVCHDADSASPSVVVGRRWFGSEALSPAEHTLLILTEGDRWSSRQLQSAVAGRECPGGEPSLRLTLGAPEGLSAGVREGAPVRGYRLASLLIYRDGTGDYWLGMRTTNLPGAWNPVQPVAGPVAAAGVRLSYYGAGGAPVSDPGRVERIGIQLTAGDGRPGSVSAETDLWLRGERVP